MGDTISSLVFRPPKPTPINPSEYFYLDVDVHSPLCTNKSHRTSDNICGADDNDPTRCGSVMCLDTGESDLASLDSSYIQNENATCTGGGVGVGGYGTSPTNNNSNHRPSGTVSNMRNGQIYKIPAFFIRRRNATQTLLFSHGNAEDLGMMYNRMKDLAMVLGVNILAYDYTGYGLSIPGPAYGNGSSSSSNRSNSDGDSSSSNNNNNVVEGPSENMIYRNIEAAFHYLTRVRKIPPHQIILYGRSLGSGPSCYLAAKSALNGESVGGLILHSPFLSVYKVVADLNGLDMGIVGDLFHNEKRAKNVRCPTLIIHGKQDEVVPFWHAQRLLAAIPPEFRAPPYYVENMGHNHIESRCRDQYVRAVQHFLRMGVTNSRILAQQQYSPTQTVEQYCGPSPIPVHERASPSETKENASFYVNKTWLRHAKVLLKEVFADVGCNVNNTSQNWGSNSSAGGTRGSVASSNITRRERGEKNNNEVVDRYNKGMSDARDDEDEFAPWRGDSNQTTGSSTPRGREPSRSPSLYAQSQKILSTRGSPNTPRYHTAQSMPATDRGGGSISVRSKSSQEVMMSQKQNAYGKSKSMQLLDGMSRPRRY